MTTSASAQVFIENGDAGDTRPTAMQVPGGITTIEGSVNGDLDLYTFYLDAPGTFQASIVTDTYRPVMFLFDGNGAGLSSGIGNVGETTASTAAVALGPGQYYLSSAPIEHWAIDGDGDTWLAVNSTFPPGDFNFLEQFNNSGASTDAGTYTITLSQATAVVPEPTGAALLIGAFSLLALRRRR